MFAFRFSLLYLLQWRFLCQIDGYISSIIEKNERKEITLNLMELQESSREEERRPWKTCPIKLMFGQDLGSRETNLCFWETGETLHNKHCEGVATWDNRQD
ncbi:hypothetical protein L6452_17379 [Arctium lappa]|uniref:Uncharacterized protein n=1 Tax=Arctium lappa TaxID=4217 RepID=A0ACB9C389_ARCLA|nr:hypothetical protein L6452_17379 [Arctium lappa]